MSAFIVHPLSNWVWFPCAGHVLSSKTFKEYAFVL